MVRALMIGFGNVAQELSKIIGENRKRLGEFGFDFVPVGIFTGSRGSIVDENGIDLGKALNDIRQSGALTSGAATPAPLEACKTLDYDVLLELTPLSIERKGEPAASHIRAALSRGISAVTANKGPVAFAHSDLADIAAKNNARFLFEATVMDGAPLFNMVSRCMKGCKITRFEGVLNSTTNYILSRMEEGLSMQEAAEEAVEAGIAEADPSNDIDGWDAAAKASVLARVFMEADITPLDVDRSGIRHVTKEMIKEAADKGKRLKLICRGERKERSARVSVGVEEFDKTNVIGGLSAFDSAICLESDFMAPSYMVQKNPTLRDTAYGILEDLLSIFTNEKV